MIDGNHQRSTQTKVLSKNASGTYDALQESPPAPLSPDVQSSWNEDEAFTGTQDSSSHRSRGRLTSMVKDTLLTNPGGWLAVLIGGIMAVITAFVVGASLWISIETPAIALLAWVGGFSMVLAGSVLVFYLGWILADPSDARNNLPLSIDSARD